jgi:hypothetical protein
MRTPQKGTAVTAYFSREEWVEYASGAAAAPLVARMKAHFLECGECENAVAELAAVDLELCSAAGRLRDHLPSVRLQPGPPVR